MADLDTALPSSEIGIKDCLDKLILITYLAYADDICLLAENEENFRSILMAFDKFCIENDLLINVKKTKVLICHKGRAKIFNPFSLNDKDLEIVNHFKYL